MRRQGVGKGIAIALALGLGVGALADSRVRIVRISFLDHNVEVGRPDPTASLVLPAPPKWGPALLNAPVVEAERIRTEAGAEAEVQLECGSALRLTPNSEFSFVKLRLRDDGVRLTTVAVQSGTAFFSVRRADSQDFHVQVPGGQIETLDGPASFRVDASASAAPTVEMIEGRATLQWGKREYPLKKSGKWTLPPSGQPTSELPAAPDHWAQWSRDRDQLFQREILANQAKPLVDATQSAPSIEIIQPAAAPSGVAIAQNPGAVFDSMDVGAGMTADPFFAPKSNAKKVPYCANN